MPNLVGNEVESSTIPHLQYRESRRPPGLTTSVPLYTSIAREEVTHTLTTRSVIAFPIASFVGQRGTLSLDLRVNGSRLVTL